MALTLGAYFQSYFTSDNASIFTSRFYQETAKNVHGNIICSPFSTHLILTFMSHSAGGSTGSELKKSILVDNNQLHTEYKNMISLLNSITDVQLHIVNSVYINEIVGVSSEFAELATNFYNSTLSKMNFKDNVNCARQINNWVATKTNNKINNIISTSTWKSTFKCKNTTNLPFYVKNDYHKLVPTMANTENYVHGDLPDLNAKFVELPCASGDLNMTIILPNEIEGLGALEENLDWRMIRKAYTSSYEKVRLKLPKFKIEAVINLNQILRNIDIKKMFDTDANFNDVAKQTPEPLFVEKIIQKAFLDVNEEGSEAAVATMVSMSFGSAASPKPVYIDFIVDRPFIVAIRHRYNDLPLFMGSVRDISG